jgi:hypothetical protein
MDSSATGTAAVLGECIRADFSCPESAASFKRVMLSHAARVRRWHGCVCAPSHHSGPESAPCISPWLVASRQARCRIMRTWTSARTPLSRACRRLCRPCLCHGQRQCPSETSAHCLRPRSAVGQRLHQCAGFLVTLPSWSTPPSKMTMPLLSNSPNMTSVESTCPASGFRGIHTISLQVMRTTPTRTWTPIKTTGLRSRHRSTVMTYPPIFSLMTESSCRQLSRHQGSPSGLDTNCRETEPGQTQCQ